MASGALVATAGCLSSGGSETTPADAPTATENRGSGVVSGATLYLSDYGPAIGFDYKIDDYATALLRAPDGAIVEENRLEPEQTKGGLLLPKDETASYTVLVRQEGETIGQQAIDVEASDVEIVDYNVGWSGGELEYVEVTARNTGGISATVTDTGARIPDGALYEGTEIDYIPPGEEVTLNLTDGLGPQVSEPGTVTGQAYINTTRESSVAKFERTFEPDSAEITDISLEWDGRALESGSVSVENTGDMRIYAGLRIEADYLTLAKFWSEEIKPGETRTYEIEHGRYVGEEAGDKAEIIVHQDGATLATETVGVQSSE